MNSKPRDKNYLQLQFWNRIYRKDSTEFQTFFEDVMLKRFSDFKKIRPYGKKGDKGNDGYIPSQGIYYQVYAPLDPLEKEAAAAAKCKKNFLQLKENWDQISQIKKYYFVYNDKGRGITFELEKALSELKADNPDIDFSVLTPQDLERIFFELKDEDILGLQFDIDSAKSLAQAYKYLEGVEIDLDKEDGRAALNALQKIEGIIVGLNNEDLKLEYLLMEARAFLKMEQIDEAKVKFELITQKYNKDPRSILYLAEIYLNEEDYEKNSELLTAASQIDNKHWLLKLQYLIRDIRQDNKINLDETNPADFPEDPRVRSSYYRIYSFFLADAEDFSRAFEFSDEAIRLNPDKIANYDAWLYIQEIQAYSVIKTGDKEKIEASARVFLTEIDKTQKVIERFGPVPYRNLVLINFRRFKALRILQEFDALEVPAQIIIDHLPKCYRDRIMEVILSEVLFLIQPPDQDLNKIFSYIKETEKKLSKHLQKALIAQFIFRGDLSTKGREYFELLGVDEAIEFIKDLLDKKYDKVVGYIMEDTRFAVGIANAAKEFPELRRKIIDLLPNDGSIQKEKLLLLLNFDQGNIDDAFEIVKSLDLTDIEYYECKPILRVAQKKGVWEVAIIILEKLIKHEKRDAALLDAKLQLFTANMNLERFLEVIKIGEGILDNKDELRLLDETDKESILGQTILARFKRGEYKEARLLLENNQILGKTYNFKLAIEAEVFLRTGGGDKALSSVVEGIKILKKPSPEEYATLFLILTEIGNLTDYKIVSEKIIGPGCFVKLEGQNQWYYLGEGNGLDATVISSEDGRYAKFLGKAAGDLVAFDNKYSSAKAEFKIENILTLERYILWQCMDNIQRLSAEHRWDQVVMIEVPTVGETIDTKYIKAHLEDQMSRGSEIFNAYCEQNLPLAFLALSEGGLTGAFGRIINEAKGYIRFSSGDAAEWEAQKNAAREAINGQEFFLDGTSALVLSEVGLIEKIYKFVPGMKIPQSVNNFILDVTQQFSDRPGHTGYMRYTKGEIIFSPLDQSKRALIKDNFEKSLKLLESKPEKIEVISAANKSDNFLEQQIFPYLSDACILAQKGKEFVLTEDFLYLKANELETKKAAPVYFSSLALIRVLYEDGKITFDEYLDYFSYLSSYRFRWLSLNDDDIKKAVFGDGKIVLPKPEQIRKFNFVLTLSENYGVQFENAIRVVAAFMFKVILDDSITPELTERLFAELITEYPKDKDKYQLGKQLLAIFVGALRKKEIFFGPTVQDKLDRIASFIEIYKGKNLRF